MKRLSLRKISLGKRFLFLASLLSVVVLVEGGVVFTGSVMITDKATHLNERDIPILNKAHELKLAVVQVQQWLTDISATRGLDGLNDGFDEAENNAKTFHTLIDELKTLDTANAERYQAMVPTFENYYVAGKKMAQAYIDEGPAGGNKMMSQFDGAAEKMSEAVDDFLDTTIAQTANLLEQQQQDVVATRLSFLVGSVIVLLGIGLVYLVMSKALAHLPKLVVEMRRVSDGDLASEIAITRGDEIGDLQEALESMRHRLLEMVSQICDTATGISRASEEMATMALQTSSNIEQQRSETNQVATAMTELTTTVHEVARSVAESANTAKDVHAETQKGSQVVEQTIGAMQHLADHFDETTNVISQLAQDSNNISSVLDVIKSIAEQTNLLALNAAIEAARAGEQGRGFAVVADEVRTLASRTQQSTEEINQMIEALQSRSSRAVQAVGQSQDEVRSVVEQVATAGASLQVITEAVGHINDMSAQIAGAAEEQSAVSEEINRNIVHIDDMASQNAISASQTAEANQQLKQTATQLQDLIRQFKV